MSTPHVAVAALAGVTSFASPCMLPVVPAFVARLGGVTTADSRFDRLQLLLHAGLFVAGFALVFAVLGVVLESVLADVASWVRTWLARVAGLFILGMGLHLTGLVRVRALDRGATLPGIGDASYLGSFGLGSAFAVTWTPCVGPILGSTFVLAASEPVAAFPIFLAYAAGLGVPFLLVALVPERAGAALSNRGRLTAGLHRAFGVLLLGLGVLVFTERLSLVGSTVYTLEALA